MDKAIYFVSGDVKGINRFERFMEADSGVKNFNVNNLIGEVLTKFFGVNRKEKDGSTNKAYYESLEDMKNCVNLSMNWEVEQTGLAVKEFLNSDKQVLIIHRSSEETRKLFMDEMLDAVKIPMFRIAFGYGDKIPCEYDYLIRPDCRDFEKQIEDIYQIEVGAGL